ncbi:MAG: GvpL/GvpF family gas vesicle protein [Bacteroidota bacterium]
MSYHYLYGISRASFPEKELPRGLLNQEVQVMIKDQLCGYYSKIPGSQAELTKFNQIKDQAAHNHPGLAHHQVVSHLASRTDLLPCAYLTGLKDEIQLEKLLRQNQSRLLQTLDKIKDHCEWVLKVKLTKEDDPALSQALIGERESELSPKPGAQYILQKLKEKQEKEAFEAPYRSFYQKIIQRLNTSFARVSPFQVIPEKELLKIIFLIPKKEQSSFKEKLRACQRDAKESQWLSSGPWPCYYFAQINLPQP